MSVKQMLEGIRSIMAKCEADERDVYEALVCEAEGWKMRLEELDADEAEDE